MISTLATAEVSATQQLRPVVIAVVVAKLAVVALLLTTVNLQIPVHSSMEMAQLR